MPPTRRWPFRFTNPASVAAAQNALSRSRVGAGEGHVHHAAVGLLNRVIVEVLTVQVIVQHLGFGGVDLLHVFQAADLVLADTA